MQLKGSNWILKIIIAVSVFLLFYFQNYTSSNYLPLLVYAAIYLVYSYFELKTNIEQTSKEQVRYYKWTRLFMIYTWAALVICPILNYILSSSINFVIMTIGIIITIIGITIRIESKVTLGIYFKSDIIVNKDNSVIQTGFYQYIRHPGYTGSILQSIGMPIILNTYYCLLLSILFIAAVFIRIYYEEKVLTENLEGYSVYKLKTKMILPFIL